MTCNLRGLIPLFLVLSLLPLFAQAPPKDAKPHVFRGRVVSVNAGAGKVSVLNEDVKGWMGPMTMDYKPDKPEVLKTLKAGDTVTATVYDGDFLTLYNLKVAAPAAAAGDLPEVVYVCPTSPEFDDKPGKCSTSGEPLVAARLTTAWSCLKNELFLREAPGPCPTDRSDMVPLTVAMHFTCKNDPRVREMNPGTCADGTARIKAFERRPHGDHNPRHGGDFVFMASDQWHHLEGTFASSGVFRLYVTDDMARPYAASQLSGRVSMANSNAEPVGPSYPLVLSKTDHSVLEARLPNTTFPFSVKVFVKFKPNEKEQVFDFTFKEYSREP
jgi:hypothetical protein